MNDQTVGARPALITPAALAATFDVPTARIYELARRGTLASIRIGRLLRFRPEDIDAFLAAGGEHPSAQGVGG
jgi:excisionase family DNA binding protein